MTTYTHKDENNKWLIKPYNATAYPNVKTLGNGDLVRLEHIQTTRNLHSHREPAPLTKKHHQVTGYGESGTGDANDVWKIVVAGGTSADRILTVTTKFSLVHYLLNCALTTSGKQLPKWAFEQQEVSCNPNIRDKNSYWNIEDNVNSKCMCICLGAATLKVDYRNLEFSGNLSFKSRRTERNVLQNLKST